jgi:KaiC/GvpD/RAD55 family RecA-like ATPase
VSYSAADRDTARAVEHFLELHGISTFFDRRNLTAGTLWFDELEEALRAAPGALVLIGSGGLGRFQKRELQFALMRQAEVEATAGAAPFRVIPVLLPPYSSDQIPGFAALNTWIEVADPSRPIELLQALRAAHGTPLRRSAACPFRGLNSFREEDALLYFGRSAAAASLRTLLGQQMFVAVVGPSGSGKSSLVHSGLLPLLRAQRPPAPTWEAVTFNPGKRPFYNAASALAGLWLGEHADVALRVSEADQIERQLLDGGSQLVSYVHEAVRRIPTDRLLIIVDQFEELFTNSEGALQRRFLESLFSCVDDEECRVVVTLRADYYGRAIEMGTRMTSILQHAQLSVGPMEQAELEQVILGPSSRAALDFEPGLVERILDDVARQPGSLPLLEFTLTELWNRSSNGRFTHADYNTIGRVEGAISTRADAVLAALGDARREKARQVLTRLVHVSSSSEEGINTRQIVTLDELDADGRKVIDEFARARLVVSGREDTFRATAEVAHEALIRTWKTLRTWIEQDAQFLVWRQRLDLFVSEWERTNHDSSSLLSGTRLAEARVWQRSHPASFTERERRFLDTSARYEAGSRVWRRTVAAVLTVAMIVAGGYYWWIHSDGYVVRAAVREAPVRDAEFAARSGDEPYVEIIQEWIATLVAARRDEDVARAVTALTMLRDCAAVTDAAYRRQRDDLNDETTRPRLDGLLARHQADDLFCVSRLPLTAMEKSEVLRAARAMWDEPPSDPRMNQWFTLRNAIYAAYATLHLTSVDDARQLAGHMLSRVVASSSDGRGHSLSLIASLLGPALSKQEQQQILEAFRTEDEHYARRTRATLRAKDATVAGLEAFIEGLAEDGFPAPPYQKVLFDPVAARAVGLVVARGVEQGEVEPSVAALDRLILRINSRDGEDAVIALVVPVADALAAADQTAEALRFADIGLERVALIDNEDERSRAIGELARVYARCGQLALAKSLADSARRARDRLAAYTAIVSNYYGN